MELQLLLLGGTMWVGITSENADFGFLGVVSCSESLNASGDASHFAQMTQVQLLDN